MKNRISEQLMIDACTIFSNKFKSKLGKLIWKKVRSNICIAKLEPEKAEDVSIIIRNPKIECKAIWAENQINFEFFYIWKLKNSKKLQYQEFALLVYDNIKEKFNNLKLL